MPKTKTAPRVSVIIPTLNEEAYLPHTLAALKQQRGATWGKDFEVIIADGESKDKTCAIARSAGARVVKEKKHTISAGRQAGVDVARGDIVLFSDADGTPCPTWVENHARVYGDKSVVSSFGDVFPSDGNAFDEFVTRAFAIPFFRIAAALGLPTAPGSNLGFRRSVLKKIGGFNINLVTGEDVDVQKRAMKHGRIVFVPHAWTKVSLRRVKNWGYVRFLVFHLSNFVRMQSKKHAYEEYEPVR